MNNELYVIIKEKENINIEQINKIITDIQYLGENNSKLFNDLDFKISEFKNDYNKTYSNLMIKIKQLNERDDDLKNIPEKILDIEYRLNQSENISKNISQIKNNIEKLSNNYYSFKNNIFDEIFPVGSYYISFIETNPSYLFGGKWEQIKDRFIIGASNNYKVNSLGGEAKHQLTVNEMPKFYKIFKSSLD